MTREVAMVRLDARLEAGEHAAVDAEDRHSVSDALDRRREDCTGAASVGELLVFDLA